MTFFKNKNLSQAEVVDSYLVLSLLDAQEPKVWRMPLDKIGAASFEIQKEQNSETTKLILKPKKGTAEIVASYDTKDKALNALAEASNALQNSTTESNTQKKPKNIPVALRTNNNGENKKWVAVLMSAIVVILFYFYVSSLVPNQTAGFNGTDTTNAYSASSPVQERTGVPVSADDFLNGL